MRYLSILMAAIFVQFTYWQFNDLTQYNTELWYLWVLTYALCCIISLVSWRVALPRMFYGIVSLSALIAALIRLQSIQWDHKILQNPNNPAGNETGGLLVIAVWMGLLAWYQHTLGCPDKNRTIT